MVNWCATDSLNTSSVLKQEIIKSLNLWFRRKLKQCLGMCLYHYFKRKKLQRKIQAHT